MAEIYDYDVSANNNNSAPPDGFPENMQYSAVNNSAREVMAVVARYIQAMGAITTTGASNAYILTVTQAPAALANGMHFMFKADKTNTGAATLQINALASAALRDVNGTALAAGAIVSGGIYFVVYDGTVFRVVGSESAANIKTKYESNADTNAYDDAAVSKLAGIESGATADQTDAEIRAAVEAATDSNVFTDADHSKLNGIESGATADQTATDIRGLSGIGATEALTGLAEIATQAETDAGSDDTRIVTPAKLAAYSGLSAGPQSVVQATDDTVNNSTTLVNTDLVLTNIPSGLYRLDMLVLARDVAVSGCGIRTDIVASGVSSSVNRLHAVHKTFAGAGTPSVHLLGRITDLFTFAGLSTGSSTDEILFSGLVDVVSGTNSIQVQFAQNTAQVGDLDFEAGSFLAMTRLGDT